MYVQITKEPKNRKNQESSNVLDGGKDKTYFVG